MTAGPLIRWFRDITSNDVGEVGGKNASLGELFRELVPHGIAIPNGFAVTADGYRLFLNQGDLRNFVYGELAALNPNDLSDLAVRGQRIRKAIQAAPFPASLSHSIEDAYAELCRQYGPDADVAVRSSATAEDLPSASFAGQQDSFLNITGSRDLLAACQRCYASLFTDRAISYRIDRHFAHEAVALSIGIQKMVRSDLGSAGVAFTLDTESGHRDVVLINAAYGLGELVVKGRIDPDEFLVHKPALRHGKRPIVKRVIGAKQEKLIYSTRGSATTRLVAVPPEDQMKTSISDDDVLTIARWACQIEDYYSAKLGMTVPQDIEWAKDGQTGALFILQARPETVHSQSSQNHLEVYALSHSGRTLLEGKSVGERIGTGPARIVPEARDLSDFRPGDVLVADMTDPDWEPTMKMASAIVTNRGGRTCHAAIVSREIGVPCVVGTRIATATLKTGSPITVSCADGETGRVYEGILPFTVSKIDVQELPHPHTQIMMNLGNPEQALKLAALPCDGVGLARIEFIISSLIRVHPMALVRFDQLPLGTERDTIQSLTRGLECKADYFINRLAEGVGQIAAAFYPRDVIVRLSDFKTDEYAGLLGGSIFEPKEANPMLGFRGASRYYSDQYREGFELECRAMRKVRDEMGLNNVKLMIPFCRTVEEGEKVLSLMADLGLKQGCNGLEIYVMCEIPSNIILTEEFATLFDGFSIGSNDLTQLTLGVDRDSEIVAPLFNERNPAVKRLIAEVIERAHACGRKVGICGQAPSDYPEFAEFLVESGIDSISLNPDTVLKTIRLVHEKEAFLAKPNGHVTNGAWTSQFTPARHSPD